MTVEEKVRHIYGMGIPDAPKPGGVYSPVRESGNLLFLSGQTPTRNGELIYRGKLGQDLTIEEGRKAAELCALNLLAVLKGYLGGDFSKIKQFVQLLGYVRSTEGFTDHPKVINGASELFVELFGNAGLASRMALGTNELPGGAAVEIMLVVELEE